MPFAPRTRRRRTQEDMHQAQPLTAARDPPRPLCTHPRSGGPVVLLKARAAADKYDAFLSGRGRGGAPRFVAPLAATYLDAHIEQLAAQLADPRAFWGTYGGGIVFTSQHGVEGWRRALRRGSASAGPQPATPPKIFVVGPATGAAARAVCAEFGLAACVVGEASGSGAALADAILAHSKPPPPCKYASLAQRPSPLFGSLAPAPHHPLPAPRLLHVVGEKHDPALAAALADAGFALDELVVYATAPDPKFEADFAAVLDGTRVRENDATVVAFAPSGVASLLRALGWLGDAGRYEPDLRRRWEAENGSHCLRILAIGPTTARHARDRLGFEVDGVADKPTPEALWECMCATTKDGC